MDETIHGLSGATSGVLAACVWYPLETIRLRLQQVYLEDHKNRKVSFTSIKENKEKMSQEITNQEGKELLNSKNFEKSEDSSKSSPHDHHEGFSHTILFIKKIISEEGIRGLYSGI